MHMHMHAEPLRVRASETQSLNSVQFLSKLISKSTQIIQKSNLIGLQHLQNINNFKNIDRDWLLFIIYPKASKPLSL